MARSRHLGGGGALEFGGSPFAGSWLQSHFGSVLDPLHLSSKQDVLLETVLLVVFDAEVGAIEGARGICPVRAS
jgi:hypothetical protein